MDEPQLFRRAFQILYGVLVLGFFGTIAVSATYGAFHRPEATALDIAPESIVPSDPAGQACKGRLGLIFEELDRSGLEMLAQVHRPDIEQTWRLRSDTFRARILELRRVCHLDAPAMLPISLIAADVERQRLAYETALRSLRQVSGEARSRLVDTYRNDAMPN